MFQLRYPDSVPTWGILCMGMYFAVLAAAIFYVLVVVWPIPVANDPTKFAPLPWPMDASLNPDKRLFLVVIACGALGSLAHTLTSFADYVGNRKLTRSWLLWLILRLPIGIGIALVLYLVLRGGLIVPTAPSTDHGPPDMILNPYGIGAISALAGMFSMQATDKLREIFNTLFHTRDSVARADPLDGDRPLITAIEPAMLVAGAEATVTVQGHGFIAGCTVSIDGKTRDVARQDDTRITFGLSAADLAQPGPLSLTVINPGPAGPISSNLFTVEVS